MKRPAVLLSVLFITIITSTALVSTAVSGIARSFYKDDKEKNISVKATPDKPVNEDFKQASVKL